MFSKSHRLKSNAIPCIFDKVENNYECENNRLLPEVCVDYILFL
jgi:hypothetical protein